MTFRAVAHAQSFSRAAEQMSLTQPSVSHQIALLETEGCVSDIVFAARENEPA